MIGKESPRLPQGPVTQSAQTSYAVRRHHNQSPLAHVHGLWHYCPIDTPFCARTYSHVVPGRIPVRAPDLCHLVRKYAVQTSWRTGAEILSRFSICAPSGSFGRCGRPPRRLGSPDLGSGASSCLMPPRLPTDKDRQRRRSPCPPYPAISSDAVSIPDRRLHDACADVLETRGS